MRREPDASGWNGTRPNEDEQLKVVTRDGKELGAEWRSVLHRSPEIVHASISVMVFNKTGDLFLQKRSGGKQVEPNKWDTSCSGHCSPGESFETAARRELLEEIGVRAPELKPFWRRISGTHRQTELIQTFLAQYEGPFHPNPAEVSEGRFWSRQEILESLGEGVFTPHLEEECLRRFLGDRWPKALALDLDGTLLDPEKRLREETLAALRAAEERGVRVFLATARPPRSARPFVEALRLDEPVIYYNGALVAHPKSHATLHHHPIDPEDVKRLVRAFRKEDPKVAISFEVMDRWLTDRPGDGFLTETGAQFMPDEVGDLESFLHQPITKVLASWPRGSVDRLADIVQALFAGRLQAWPTDGALLLQIMRRGVGKEVALLELLSDVGLTPRDLLAVGDDMNDAGMLNLAMRAVAMGNAPEPLKRLADDVTTSNAERGVARTVEKYILSNSPAR